jgi:RNA polymerase primary sigma factor
VDDLRRIIARNTANLNEIEQRVLRARFALGTPSSEQQDPMTLEEVGQIIGVTKERVRQIQNKALEKLRKCFEDSVLAA